MKNIPMFRRTGKIIINLNGPEGNAYFLLSLAQVFAKLLGKNADEICDKMTSSGYYNLVSVFTEEFGYYVEVVGSVTPD